MKKIYQAPVSEKVNLDPLMQNFDGFVAGSDAKEGQWGAPARGNEPEFI